MVCATTVPRGIILLLMIALFLLVVPVHGDTMVQYNNKNIQGGDYETVIYPPAIQANGAEACRDSCLNRPTCTAVTYQLPAFTGTVNAECWYKIGTFTESQLQDQHDTIIWLRVKAPTTGTMVIKSTPPGASIELDGDHSSGWITPHTFTDLSAGSHVVRLTLAGYEDDRFTASVPAGDTITYDEQLSPAQPPAPTTGSLSVTSTPSGAAVLVDDVSRGITPTTISDIPVGSHAIRVTLPGYSDYEGSASISAGSTTPLTVSLAAVRSSSQDTGSSSSSSGGSTSGGSTSGGSTSSTSNPGTVEVRSQPSGAIIIFDGLQKGVTPAKLTNVKAGTHELKLTLTGYPEWKQTITVKSSETTSINAPLAPATTGSSSAAGTQAPSAGTGSLAVVTEPAGAQVYIDGVLIGNSPTTTSGLADGSHSLSIKKDGYQDLSVSVTIRSGETTQYSSSLVENTAVMNKKAPGFAVIIGILALAMVAAGRRIPRP